MQFVSTRYCPDVDRTCLHEELIRDQHITICHAFTHETRCLAPQEERAVCIDTYEYPNRQGAHPTWMVTWYDAQATCESKGKRLCYDSEWTAACEGPEHLPFPYGWERDNTACNIDNEYIRPSLARMGSPVPSIQLAELERLDQSVPSGARPRCVSGFGVHDLTGNFDEWVVRDDDVSKPRGAGDIGKWAALKGGAWGHVRSACRPTTVGQDAGFAYYFVAFRCCKDPEGSPPYAPKNIFPPPKVAPADRAPLPNPEHAPGPSETKVKMDRGY
jgi:formylglycine-generating enzyme required for sulfatase activity